MELAFKRGCIKSLIQPLFIRIPDGDLLSFKQFSALIF